MLLRRMHSPRRAKFESLVEGYCADLYRYAAWQCGDRALAEDLVQETFSRAWVLLDGRRERAPKPWLFALLRREYIKLCARPRPSSGGDGRAEGGRHATGADVSALRRAVAALATEYREPLVLQVIGGFSCEEIAEILDVGAGAVTSRLFWARKQLREIMSNDRVDHSNKVMA